MRRDLNSLKLAVNLASNAAMILSVVVNSICMSVLGRYPSIVRLMATSIDGLVDSIVVSSCSVDCSWEDLVGQRVETMQEQWGGHIGQGLIQEQKN